MIVPVTDEPSEPDSPAEIRKDLEAVARIRVVPEILKLACDNTGMGFAAVARVTDGTWTACAVEDRISFGLLPGGQLPVQTTLCREAREVRRPIVFDHASEDPLYREHHTPLTYNIESYISVPIIRPDGRYFGNLCAIDPKPAKVSDERTVRMFTSMANMIAQQLTSDDEHAERELLMQDQRRNSELREQFIAVLGHDLRNPLDAVSMAGELLLRRPNEQDKKLGERLLSSTRRMTGLIENLLDFARARLGAGIGVEIRSATSLNTALSAVVEESRSAHPGISVQSDVDIDVPVQCDPPRLQQLLSNLLGNAFHHGDPDQPVQVSARVNEGRLVIAVSNGGASIAEADLAKIFQPYWRPANSKPGGGLGLGLYICSEIVKAHGGTLRAAASGDRVTFTATIPVSQQV